jgi:hypothetical protein
MLLVAGIVGCVLCTVWFAILAARTDRRENSPYDYEAEDYLDDLPTPRKGV